MQVIAAYDAPYPNPASKAGARAFPLMLPTDARDAGRRGRPARARRAARRRRGPSSSCGPTRTRCCRSRPGSRFAGVLGTDVAHVIADASHFLQEDAGPQIGSLIADWLTSSS